MADVLIVLEGWGYPGWGGQSWGETLFEEGAVTADIGDVEVRTSVVVSVTGNALTTANGTVIVREGTGVHVTGEELTTDIDGVTVTGTSVYETDGVTGTFAVGNVIASISITAPVTGEFLTTAFNGAASVTGGATINAVTNHLTSAIGSVVEHGDANISVTGFAMTFAIGTPRIELPVNVTGVSASFDINGVDFIGGVDVLVDGIDATIFSHKVFVHAWGPIVPPGGDNWTPVPTGSNNWTPVDTTGPDNWTPVTPI